MINLENLATGTRVAGLAPTGVATINLVPEHHGELLKLCGQY